METKSTEGKEEGEDRIVKEGGVEWEMGEGREERTKQKGKSRRQNGETKKWKEKRSEERHG